MIYDTNKIQTKFVFFALLYYFHIDNIFKDKSNMNILEANLTIINQHYSSGSIMYVCTLGKVDFNI